MPSREIEFGSCLLGGESQGCVHCRHGAKLVLLITGLCSYRCFYCPLSEKKMNRDVVFANELLLPTVLNEDNEPEGNRDGVRNEQEEIRVRDEQLIREADSISATGTGITGGDPMLVLDRTLHFIRLLKDHFGKDHHIHLYTGTPVTFDHLEKLRVVGLDEIRYHLIDLLEDLGPVDNGDPQLDLLKNYTDSIRRSLSLGLDTGVEIPVLPDGLDTLKWLAPLLEKAGTMFLNLNELEFSPTNSTELLDHGYRVRDEISSAVLGSSETAVEFMEWAEDQEFTMAIHFCSSQYKDAGQLRRRLHRRAENTALPHEELTNDETLLLGIIELESGTDDALEEAGGMLRTEFNIPEELVYVNHERSRIEIVHWILEEIAPYIEYPVYIIEEYPSSDRLEVEREKLN